MKSKPLGIIWSRNYVLQILFVKDWQKKVACVARKDNA